MRYRVGEFATLTGVTVRALQHYDRLGLLTPSRTGSGHRLYTTGDQRRVRHILALRTVGMSLQRIAQVLDAPPSRLSELFEEQRASLEQSRAGIAEAIRTLEQIDINPGDSSTGSGPSATSVTGLRPPGARCSATWKPRSASIRRSRGRENCWPGRRRCGMPISGQMRRWDGLQRRYGEFRIEAIARFLGEVAMASWRREGLMHTYTASLRSSA